jgi:hypothetical protein
VPQGGELTGGNAGQPGTYDPNDVRQWAREVGQRLTDLQGIRNGLPRNDPSIPDLDRAIQALQNLQRGGFNRDARDIEASLQGIIDPLRNVELQLSRELQIMVEKENVRSAKEEDTPTSYKKENERYYEALGRLKP